MSRSSMLWGASIVCALAGAVVGTSLGSSPVVAGARLPHSAQTHPEAAASLRHRQAEILPDRFPLVTPGGTIPVDRLSDRGLLSEARYRRADAGRSATLPPIQPPSRPAAAADQRATATTGEDAGPKTLAKVHSMGQPGPEAAAAGGPVRPVHDTVLTL